MASRSNSGHDRHQETAGNAGRIFAVVLLIHVLAVGAAVAWQGMRRWQQPMMAFRLGPAAESPLNDMDEVHESASGTSAPLAQVPVCSTAASPLPSSKPLHHRGHMHVGQGALSMASQKMTSIEAQTNDDGGSKKAPVLATNTPNSSGLGGKPSIPPVNAAHWSISMATPVPDLPHASPFAGRAVSEVVDKDVAQTNTARPASPPVSAVSYVETPPAPKNKTKDAGLASSQVSVEPPVSHKSEENSPKPASHLHEGNGDPKPNHQKVTKPGVAVPVLLVGGSYKVHKGETFYSIARKLHVKLHDLMALNPDKKAGGLYEGVKLKLPSKHNVNGGATRQS